MIEHIKNDESFLQDVYRVLKPGGMLLLTIPNRELSLTNNPWHEREYSTEELTALLSRCFEKVTVSSVTENQNVMAYYEKNKRAVAELIKYDLLHLKNRLPKHLLRILYDLLNRITRKNFTGKMKIFLLLYATKIL